jgi:hypothetical protein
MVQVYTLLFTTGCVDLFHVQVRGEEGVGEYGMFSSIFYNCFHTGLHSAVFTNTIINLSSSETQA